MKTRRVLICAHRMPEFDREGGSRRIFHLIELFQQDGWAASFAAEHCHDGARYARTLQQMGIATYALQGPWIGGEASLIAFDRLVGTGHFDMVLFAFWTCAESYMIQVHRLSPRSTLVVDSVDLHFLRQSRRVFSSPDTNGGMPLLDSEYADQMRRELNVYASADAVLTVSEKEANLVNDFVGRSLAHSIPDTEDRHDSTVPIAERRGMLFVGNFRHPPNVQAIEFLCGQIVPKLPRSLLAAHPIQVVGNDPGEVVRRSSAETEGVRLVGWVPSVLPYIERARLSLIPLLHGAGTKRKLMQSLMVGTPSVSTSVGIEGLNLEDGLHVLVADGADRFAEQIVRLAEDDDLWQFLADRGRSFISTTHGREAVYERFSAVLRCIERSRSEEA